MLLVSIVTRNVAIGRATASLRSEIDLAACKLGTGVVTCDTVVIGWDAGVVDENTYESDEYDDAGVVDVNGRLKENAHRTE